MSDIRESRRTNPVWWWRKIKITPNSKDVNAQKYLYQISRYLNYPTLLFVNTAWLNLVPPCVINFVHNVNSS
ncbi:hypothetical protein RhiirB3_113171 [Rhizophagus irregularis]|nr:hypothetical protein RhiirB3_113171 [Rhizophagus irregularis]